MHNFSAKLFSILSHFLWTISSSQPNTDNGTLDPRLCHVPSTTLLTLSAVVLTQPAPQVGDPHRTQLSLSHLDFLFWIAGYGREEEKREKKFSVLWRLCLFISKHWQFTLESPRRKIKPCSPTFQKSSRSSNNPSFAQAGLTKSDLAWPADVARTSAHCRNGLRQICSQPKPFQ